MTLRRPGAGTVALLATLAAAGASEAQTVNDIARRGACDTSGVQGLSNQLVVVHMCLAPGAFVAFAPHAGISLSSTRIHAYLTAPARTALWAAASRLTLQINSAFRTLADQYVLYHSGACGLAAMPGNSNHESGRAVDLQNYSAALSAMTSAGCSHPYPGSDPVHFDCPGADMRADSIRAFQRLWNVNNPGDRIAEDGAYGPATASRMSRSPARGFADPADCTTPSTPDWGGQYVAQSFPSAAAGSITMRVGESVPAFIDMRNIGGRAWDGATHLSTTAPRDRSSGFAGPEWPGPNRVSAVTGTVAPGSTFRFNFVLHAPPMPGTYAEHFGMVQEGVAWFSDPGQGGPPDSLLEARIVVLPAEPMMDAGMPSSDSGADASNEASADGAMPGDGGDAASADGGDAARTDADAARGDARYAADGALITDNMAGCGCHVPARPDRQTRSGLWLALVAVAAALSRRARRKGTHS